MTAAVIRTVLGDIDPEDCGSINYHEHLFQVSPLLRGDELDDPERSGEEAHLVRTSGTDLMVEATPHGLAARPYDVATISRAAGLRVVHVTGLHHGGHYPDDHPLHARTVDKLAARFVNDLTSGFEPPPSAPSPASPVAVRAGMLKAAARYWAIGDFERKGLDAVAAAHRATGAPIMVHLEHGSAAHEVLDLLTSGGVAGSSVVLAHMDRNLDAGLHVDLIARGCCLGYDGWARHREAPDSAIIDCIRTVVSHTGGAGIVLGGDVARSSRYLSYGGIPGLPYLENRVIPRLTREFDAPIVHRLRAANARALLAYSPT